MAAEKKQRIYTFVKGDSKGTKDMKELVRRRKMGKNDGEAFDDAKGVSTMKNEESSSIRFCLSLCPFYSKNQPHSNSSAGKEPTSAR